MTATIFVVAGQMGATNAWDERKGDVAECLMGIDQILEAQREGMHIGSHTSTHPDLAQCSDRDAITEIEGSKRILESALGRSIDWFSYPYGSESGRVQAIVQAAGYSGACGTRRRLNTARTDRFSLARINVRASTTVPWLIYKLIRARREMI